MTEIKVLPILVEGTHSMIAAKSLKNKDVLNQLAEDLLKRGFPADFKLTLQLSNGKELPVRFYIDGKSINESNAHHIVTLRYELSSKSFNDVRDFLKKYENDPNDEEGLIYDRIQDELNVDTIYISADFPFAKKALGSLD